MNMTLDQIRKLGYEALVEKLGPVGMVRFLQQTIKETTQRKEIDGLM